MTIHINLYHPSTGLEGKTIRGIARHNYQAYVAGFFANRDNYQWGAMYQLKGTKRILLHVFGVVDGEM